jgi:hypothetical protein
MKEIKVAKLISGEMVVGYYEGDTLFLKECFNIHIRQQETGGMSVSLLPYMLPFSQVGSDIDSEIIIAEQTAPEELEKMYLGTISGIIIPTNVRI